VSERALKEAHTMVKWKRNARTIGATLSAATVALLATEGTAAAQGSTAHPDRVFGTVTSVGTDSLTLQLRDGTLETISTTPTTAYSETGTPFVPSGVLSGDRVDVTLDPTDATPTASSIAVILNRIGGRVVSVDGSSVRLADRHHTRDFLTTPSTEYTEGSATAGGVSVGELVTAFGTPNAAVPSDLVAEFVDIAKSASHTPPPPVGPGPAGVSPPPAQPQTTGSAGNTANPGIAKFPPPSTFVPRQIPPAGRARHGNRPDLGGGHGHNGSPPGGFGAMRRG
jgi:hypothetical protein